MREILFRGKRVEDGEWVYGSYVNGGMTVYGSTPHHTIAAFGCYPEEVDGDTLGQYTGLKDKHNRRIFEGDVVLFTYWWFDGNEAESNLTGEIVYSEDFMSFQLKGVKNKEWEQFTGHSGEDYLTPFSELNFSDADFEIIGNIHEEVRK